MENNTVNLDQEKESDLQEIKELTIENNKMLHGMRSRARWGTVFRGVYWLVILGIAVGSFIYIEPYVKNILDAYKSLQATQEKVNGISSNFNLDALKSYFSGTTTQNQ